MATEHTREGRFRRESAGVAFGLTIAGYLMLPLLKFADPVGLAFSGAMLGIGVAETYQQAVLVSDPKRRKRGWAMVAVMSGLLGLVATILIAASVSYSLDRICLDVQAELLAANSPKHVKSSPPIPDAKDRFQALGCRYQTPGWWVVRARN